MNSVNQQIMREILTEEPDFTSAVHGETLVKAMGQSLFLDKKTRTLLWQGRDVARTFFGDGLLDQMIEHEHEEDEETLHIYCEFLNAFLIAGIVYQSRPEQDPHELLVSELSRIFSAETSEEDVPQGNSDHIWEILADLIECETLAPWLMVCEVNF